MYWIQGEGEIEPKMMMKSNERNKGQIQHKNGCFYNAKGDLSVGT